MAKKEDKFCVLDTNVLVYALNTASKENKSVRKMLATKRKQGYLLCVTEQIVRETLVVVTQPNLVSKPLDTLAAKRLGTQLLYRFVFLPSNNYSRICLLELIDQYKLKGPSIHDANIVAVMMAHGVQELITYNKKDFSCFSEISLHSA